MSQNKNQARSAAKRLFLGLAMLLLALTLAACGNNDNEAKNNADAGNKAGNNADASQGGSAGANVDPQTVVAKYDGGQVTQNELTAFLGAHKFFNLDQMYMYYEMSPTFKEDMLHQLIAMRMISEEATDAMKNESKDQAGKDIKDLEETAKSSDENKKQFDEFMKSENITLGDLESYMATRYTLQKVFTNKYTDDEIKKKFDENVAKDKDTYTTATVRHVLVSFTDAEGKERSKEDALKRAQEVQGKLKNGGDWTALAKEYSDDPGSKENGGQYADARVGSWVANFRKGAIEQPIGEIGQPIETEYGYHVMVVEKRSTPGFDEVKGEVANQMIGEFFANLIEVEVPKLITEVNLPKPEQPESEAAPAEDAGAQK